MSVSHVLISNTSIASSALIIKQNKTKNILQVNIFFLNLNKNLQNIYSITTTI